MYYTEQDITSSQINEIDFIEQTIASCCITIFSHAKVLKIAKRFGSCQPARTAQADMSRYFSQMQSAPFLTDRDRFTSKTYKLKHTTNNKYIHN